MAEYKKLDIEFINNSSIPEQLTKWTELNGWSPDSIITFLGPVNARLIALAGLNKLTDKHKKECYDTLLQITKNIPMREVDDIAANWPDGPITFRLAVEYAEILDQKKFS